MAHARPKSPDYLKARTYAMHLLRGNLEHKLPFHNHVRTKEVLAAATGLAKRESIEGEDRLLLQTAALYQDIGYAKGYEKNLSHSLSLAGENLLIYGYNPRQIKIISSAINAVHGIPQTSIEFNLSDANTDYYGRKDFFIWSEKLRLELAETVPNLKAKATVFSPWDWGYKMFRILSEHEYFTKSARELRQVQKEENIRKFEECLGF